MIKGDRLRKLREERGLTGEQLAEALDIGTAQVFRYEAEKTAPSSTVVIKIARYFSVSADYLLGLTDIPKPHPRKPLSLKINLTALLKVLDPEKVAKFINALNMPVDIDGRDEDYARFLTLVRDESQQESRVANASENEEE